MAKFAILSGDVVIHTFAADKLPSDKALIARARQLCNESYHGEITVEYGQLYCAIVFAPYGDYEAGLLRVVEVPQ